jgi:hypothetical protein
MSKVADMRATNRHPDVSPPAGGARDVSSWDTDDTVRVFFGTLRNATAVIVDIAWLQYGDGSVERHISLYAPDLELDAATAREVATDLLDAADELGHHADNDRALSPHVHKPCRGNGRHVAW